MGKEVTLHVGVVVPSAARTAARESGTGRTNSALAKLAMSGIQRQMILWFLLFARSTKQPIAAGARCHARRRIRLPTHVVRLSRLHASACVTRPSVVGLFAIELRIIKITSATPRPRPSQSRNQTHQEPAQETTTDGQIISPKTKMETLSSPENKSQLTFSE